MAKKSSARPTPALDQSQEPQSYSSLNEWLGPRDISRYLSVPYSTAYKLIKKLPHRKFGKHVRVAKHLLCADPSGCVPNAKGNR